MVSRVAGTKRLDRQEIEIGAYADECFGEDLGHTNVMRSDLIHDQLFVRKSFQQIMAVSRRDAKYLMDSAYEA